ncbi:flagellar export protein FliJ [Alteromonas sp. a30]|uniref:flagellar export protein FliJ n=1 Tax=Alteromonas sp. a30 TaxID=2730917 RepID=UPI00227E6766|nr:flagellar export protein FliJ [Alteromonas sp. a30]MCY7294429.1 flagellar export protein FliJ [Alteromonas sp. a30]
MANSQLHLVAQLEQEKEEKAAMNFQLAQSYVNEQRMKLQGLEQYRLDYFRQIQLKGRSEGLKAMTFNQHQDFIAKLDSACEQQRKIIHNAVLAADQRKSIWLQHQQKRKAVEMLLEKKKQEALMKEAKQDQKLMDEVATQRFFRRIKN